MPKMGVTCSNGMGTCDMALSCLRGLLLLSSGTLWARRKGQDLCYPQSEGCTDAQQG